MCLISTESRAINPANYTSARTQPHEDLKIKSWGTYRYLDKPASATFLHPLIVQGRKHKGRLPWLKL